MWGFFLNSSDFYGENVLPLIRPISLSVYFRILRNIHEFKRFNQQLVIYLDLEYARHTFQKGQSLGLLITTIAHTMASRLEPGNTK